MGSELPFLIRQPSRFVSFRLVSSRLGKAPHLTHPRPCRTGHRCDRIAPAVHKHRRPPSPLHPRRIHPTNHSSHWTGNKTLITVTMIGRRVGVLFQLPLQSRLLRTNPVPAHQHQLPIRTLACQPRRGYATPGRPRKAVGEPSRPVKRAVNRTSSAATSSADSPAKQKTDARKKTAAKKKPAKAPKKVLTEEQKAVKAARADKLKMTELRKAALAPPPAGSGASSAYIEFTKERAHRLKERRADDSSANHKQLLAEHAREVASEWKNATPAEVEVRLSMSSAQQT